MNSYREYVAACCRGTTIAALLIAGSSIANAQRTAPSPNRPSTQPAQESTLGAHTLLTHSEGLGVSPAITAPITTQASGSTLIVFNGGYADNDAPPLDSYANRWKPLSKPANYGNGYERFSVQSYIALAARGGPGHTVSIAKTGQPAGEISVPFIEIQAGVLKDVAQNYPEANIVVTSGKVTTTGPATLIALWWGDGGVKRMSAVPNNGFTVIERFLKLPDNSGVQCAVAFKQVQSAGTYDVSWIGTPMQGAILWLLAFQAP
ncbi:MAG: hypothetical protein ABW154_02010 [Dyella sp.]